MSYNIKVNQKKQDNSSLTYIFIIGFFILTLSVNLFKLVREYFSKRILLSNEKNELTILKNQQANLRLKIKQSQTRDYIEEKARALSLAKPQEIIVIVASITPSIKPSPTLIPHIANYKLWYKLFFE